MLRCAILSLIVALASPSALRHPGSVEDEFHGNRSLSLTNNPTVHADAANLLLWRVQITNLAFSQPFGPTFVVVHSSNATALFTLGGTASAGLKLLAEEGSSAALVAEYTGGIGVLSAAAETGLTGPLMAAGQSRVFLVETGGGFPHISLASMAVNTNDCFAGFNLIRPYDGMRLVSPGYDAGTEGNDELCTHIPGPACGAVNKTNDAAKGEGVILVHRGLFGTGNLTQSVYDWRNPMLQVKFSRVY